MPKIKLVAAAMILGVVGFVLSGARHFSADASGDVQLEIANYKTWSKITEKPIKAEFTIDASTAGG